jgi:hypothetical protein
VKIFYFHGFASSPESSKVKLLRDAGFDVSAPIIDIDPSVAEPYLTAYLLTETDKAMEAGETKFCFVGTSLGGFWAARMGEKFDTCQVLINPAMSPEVALKRYIGPYTNYATGENKVLTTEVVESYKDFSSAGASRDRMCFISTRDSEIQPYIPCHRATLYDIDDHQGLSFFDDVIKYLTGLSNSKCVDG